jgi:hypothetical protein
VSLGDDILAFEHTKNHRFSFMKIGKNSVVMGLVSPDLEVGEGCVIIGPTDERGNTIIDKSMAVGHGAQAGPDSIAIGAFSGAGILHQSTIDFRSLAHELETLRIAMRKEATITEHDIAIWEVAAAQTAAAQGNGAKALEHLKNAGQWAFDVSTKIGVGVAIAAIKTALST